MPPYQVAYLGTILCINFVILLRSKVCVKFEWSVINGSKNNKRVYKKLSYRLETGRQQCISLKLSYFISP